MSKIDLRSRICHKSNTKTFNKMFKTIRFQTCIFASLHVFSNTAISMDDGSIEQKSPPENNATIEVPQADHKPSGKPSASMVDQISCPITGKLKGGWKKTTGGREFLLRSSQALESTPIHEGLQALKILRREAESNPEFIKKLACSIFNQRS